jgi:hypothetical protein
MMQPSSDSIIYFNSKSIFILQQLHLGTLKHHFANGLSESGNVFAFEHLAFTSIWQL